MKITHIDAWQESLPLTRPYTIAFKTVSAVDLFFVRIMTDTGLVGLGSAAPAQDITGESSAACLQALQGEGPAVIWGRDVRHLGALTHLLKTHLAATPAARAALDMAVLDLFAQHLGVPLVDLLGRMHEGLPTSITIGILPTDETLAEAEEYLGRGFRCLKVKIGHSLEADVARLHRLRELVGPSVLIRVDANQGYDGEEAEAFEDTADALDLELIEQPLPGPAVAALRSLPASLKARIAADESLHTEADALRLAQAPPACGTFNIKLMKCGGVTSALSISAIAEAAGIDLMWGCMDESTISITAALHAAYACPTTRYLDLDGSFDLSRDLATGGFRVHEGRLYLPEAPGLGVALAQDLKA